MSNSLRHTVSLPGKSRVTPLVLIMISTHIVYSQQNTPNSTPPCIFTAKLWKDGGRCGPGNLLDDGVTPAQCNPTGVYPCCSPNGWCGNTNAHCNCAGCVDYSGRYGEGKYDGFSGENTNFHRAQLKHMTGVI